MELGIEDIVRQHIRNEIEDADVPSIIRDEVRTILRETAGKEIASLVTSEAKAWVDEAIRDVLDGEVVINDGWGKVTTYANFEDLVKKTFKEEITGTYKMSSAIDRLAKERVAALMANERNAVVEKVVDELTHSKLVKPKA